LLGDEPAANNEVWSFAMRQLKQLGLAVVITAALGTSYAVSQSEHQGHSQHGNAANPYAAFNDRQIKALSPENLADLRAGRGMGLALAAEMNGYPGPKHVLQLGDQIGLSADQRTKIDALSARMQAEAIVAGEKLIALERDLDKLFAARTITDASLERLTKDIGVSQAHLRATHLRYHLDTVAILSAEQIMKYKSARGYAR
jgi:hypothetical protein